jgi:hypothetical protein
MNCILFLVQIFFDLLCVFGVWLTVKKKLMGPHLIEEQLWHFCCILLWEPTSNTDTTMTLISRDTSFAQKATARIFLSSLTANHGVMGDVLGIGTVIGCLASLIR